MSNHSRDNSISSSRNNSVSTSGSFNSRTSIKRKPLEKIKCFENASPETEEQTKEFKKNLFPLSDLKSKMGSLAQARARSKSRSTENEDNEDEDYIPHVYYDSDLSESFLNSDDPVGAETRRVIRKQMELQRRIQKYMRTGAGCLVAALCLWIVFGSTETNTTNNPSIDSTGSNMSQNDIPVPKFNKIMVGYCAPFCMNARECFQLFDTGVDITQRSPNLMWPENYLAPPFSQPVCPKGLDGLDKFSAMFTYSNDSLADDITLLTELMQPAAVNRIQKYSKSQYCASMMKQDALVLINYQNAYWLLDRDYRQLLYSFPIEHSMLLTNC